MMNEDKRKAVALDDEELKAVSGGIASQVQIVDPKDDGVYIGSIVIESTTPSRNDAGTIPNDLNDKIRNL